MATGTYTTSAVTTTSRTLAAATASTPPAGGTGTAAGGYDTSGNRDLMIAAITANQADIAAIRNTLNALIRDLQANTIIG